MSTDITSKFSERIRALIGKDAPDDFESEELIGQYCRLETKQIETTKGTFANIVKIAALTTGKPKKPIAIPLNFTRAIDRPGTTTRTNSGTRPGGSTRTNLGHSSFVMNDGEVPMFNDAR